jgi:carbon-monoxide dehydrogenase medium subunit
MKFYEPATVEQALAYLAEDARHRCLAGGATLVAMMNAQLVEPAGLVSLGKIAALQGIQRSPDGAITIGAMTLHQSVADCRILLGAHALVREAARRIGHPAIRNMGTIGGAICHADAAADYPAPLVAAGADIEIAGRNGRRRLPAELFFVDYLKTALEPGELVVAVHLPPASSGAGSAYEKFARVDGDFATVSAAVVLSFDAETCSDIRVALGGCGPVPVRVPAAEERLRGTPLDERAIGDACAALQQSCDPVSDFRGSAEYRLKLVPVMVRRAIAKARARVAERRA